MTDQEPQEDEVLTKVARTVGSALGTVVSKAAEVVGAKPDVGSHTPETKGKKVKSGTSPKRRALEQKKAKRNKHRRTLGRKTRG